MVNSLQFFLQEDLLPHASTLLLFTVSAQTHIFPEIRIDAIRLLDVLLEFISEAVVEGWSQGVSGNGQRVLEAYLGILNAGTIYGGGGGQSSPHTPSIILLSSYNRYWAYSSNFDGECRVVSEGKLR